MGEKRFEANLESLVLKVFLRKGRVGIACRGLRFVIRKYINYFSFIFYNKDLQFFDIGFEIGAHSRR